MVDDPEATEFRASVRRWVDAEIAPQVNAWDEAGSFQRGLYRRAAELGRLQLGYPEAPGDTPCSFTFRRVAAEEIARTGAGGLLASLFSHNIGLPPIVAHGSPTLQRRIVPLRLRFVP
jgi:acyl-CoA dehydrogenase